MHESGEWLSQTLTMTAKDDSPQAIGSTITYARRYALAAVAGVAPEDDDGETAQGRGNGVQAKPKDKDAEPDRLNKSQKDTAAALIKLITAATDDHQVDQAAKLCLDDHNAGKITKGQLDLLSSIGRQQRESLKAMDAMNERFDKTVGAVETA
jgi:hypothetical protein